MKTVIAACVLFFSIAGVPQPDIKRLPTNSKSIELDGSGKVYFVDEKLNLCSYNSRTDSTKKFSVSNYGLDPVIDASNPLEIFVFFPLTGKLVVFDNQLNIQSDLNVFTTGYLQPAGFGRANDGNIWLMDKNTGTLKKINREGTVLNESIILSGFRSNEPILRIYDNGESVFLQDAENTVFVFDKNGIQKERFNSFGELLGYGNDEIYFSYGKHLVKKNKPFEFSVPDTIINIRDSIDFLRVNSGYIIERTPTALILCRFP